ncbi:MBOAT family protein [Wohlfahrtiimonas chitiniclastica]|uniref:MBOAT family O-acyltransferase n=1 Tax=Wohlfahrtiimonas chitiniclastica TaxID=400946 RepID=UPI001BCE1FD4|nr:MBOAT family protein [Wohlfahrtiimonas chitiniclastica]
MSYLSIEFAAAFVPFFVLYWCLRLVPALQNALLLIVSYVLIALFNVDFALILGAYTVVIYLLSTGIAYSPHRKLWLTVAIIAAIGNLAVFKYYNFFIAEFMRQLAAWNIDLSMPIAEILLPIGISFYTFHSISYLVSVYHQEEKMPVSFFDFALFLSFFPSVIAGPINRAKLFLPQIQQQTPRTVLEPTRAMILLVSAVIKVYWLSAFLSYEYVKPIFDNPSAYHTFDLILGLWAYAFEIYFNFSGYTDLVTGIALLLGFRLPQNFNVPYMANNLKEFWQRWHISLSTWIRDYIYIPLGGSRGGFTRTQINVLIAMVLSGIWHGETLTFLVWGVIHGVGTIALNIGDRFWKKDGISSFSPFLARFLMFNYICLGWLFFRSATLSDAGDYALAMVSNYGDVMNHLKTLAILVAGVAVYYAYPWLLKGIAWIEKIIHMIHWTVLPFVLIVVLVLVIDWAPSGIPQFIYASF